MRLSKIIFSILFCLVLAGSVLAKGVYYYGSQSASSVPDYCPSYYTSAVLSWTGDGSNHLQACNSSGDAITFTSSSADIGTYGEDSSYALKCDDIPEFMYYVQTANQYGDFTKSQTICLRVYNSAAGSNFDSAYVSYIRISDSETDTTQDRIIGTHYNTGPALVNSWANENGNLETANGDPVQYNAWHTIGFSNDVADTDYLSTNPGDQAPPDWQDGWEPDADAIVSMVDDATTIRVGTYSDNEFNTGDPGDTEYYIIDEWAIFDGYNVDCSDYM